MRKFLMLVRREWWEHRAGFLWAPLITAFAVLGFVALAMGLALWHRRPGTPSVRINIGIPLEQLQERLDAEQLERVGVAIDTALLGLWGLIQIPLFLVLFFYLVGTLHDERRDRSILFWKSLPVSDRDTVLAKVVSATVVAPALALVIAYALQFAFLVLLAGFVSLHGLDPMRLVFGPAEPLAVWLKMLASLPVNVLWALPAVGWLLLCSAVARARPFLWAVLLPVGLGALIGFLDLLESFGMPSAWYWVNVVTRLYASLVPLSWSPAFIGAGQGELRQLLSWQDFAATLGSTTMWVGAVAGAAGITAAAYVRGRRELAD